MAGGEGSVVQETPTVDDVRRFGVIHRGVADFRLALRINDLDRVVEAGKNIEAVSRFVQGETGGAAAAHGDLIRRARNEGVVLELRGVIDGNLAGADRSYVQSAAIRGDLHTERERDARRIFRGVQRAAGRVINVLIEVPRGDVSSAVEDCDAAEGNLPPYRRR